MRKKAETTQLCLKLPLEVRAKVDLHLFSVLEGRVPMGEYQRFFDSRIREYFEWEGLDLSKYGFGEGTFVRGPKESITQLQMRLEALENEPT